MNCERVDRGWRRLRRPLSGVVAGAVLLFTGWSGEAWIETVCAEALPGRTVAYGELRSAPMLAEHCLAGVLGGLRAPVRDLLWLRAYLAWERRDATGLDRHLRLAVRVDPRALHPWLEGARMMAYDLPRWEPAEDEPAWGVVRRRHALRALEFLEAARHYHSGEPRVVLEAALIWLHQMKDPARAADLFGAAATMSGAPYYAGRIRGELLWRMGRLEEAYDWYRAIYPTLPDGVPEARKTWVAERIAMMEKVLGRSGGGEE